MPGPGLCRGGRRRTWWRWRRRRDLRQQRSALTQSCNGQFSAAACLRAVVAFVDEPDAAGPEVVDSERPVAERVGYLVGPADVAG